MIRMSESAALDLFGSRVGHSKKIKDKNQNFDLAWERFGSPEFKHIPELQFHPGRRYRFDRAFVAQKLAIEVQGGIFIKGVSGHGGAHCLPTNILRDMEKGNLAVVCGWDVLRFTPQELQRKPQECIEMVLEVLRRKG